MSELRRTRRGREERRAAHPVRRAGILGLGAPLRPRQGSFPATCHVEEGLSLHLPSFPSAAVPLLSSISTPPGPCKASAVDGVTLGLVGPLSMGGMSKLPSWEQRLSGLRRQAHISLASISVGMGRPGASRPGQPVASAAWSQCWRQGHPLVHPIWPLLFAGLAAVGKDPPGQWRQPRRRSTERGR